jgi:AbrB family looped-hinge helix DNA binding protein
MAVPSTTKMSSKGQFVIPEAIRKRLDLVPGDQFVVVASKDAVILRAIATPTMDEFDELLADARRQARRAGLKRSDVADAIAATRRER